MMQKNPLRYKDAGVDLTAWESIKQRMKEDVTSSFNDRVLGAFGGFGGLFDARELARFTHPVLVSSVDGVGTKLKIAVAMGRHDSIGQDLVNHCINDILVCGARPLFFLDYLGCGRLEPEVAAAVIRGFARACKEADCPLVGGETAEMPGFYQAGEYDVSGTIVGVVEHDRITDGAGILPGDVLIGCASNGLHTNGYSLARKVVTEYARKSYTEVFADTGRSFGDELLRIHRSYRALHGLITTDTIKGCAHITGGGFRGNINRMLPAHCDAVIETGRWSPEPVFSFIQSQGGVEAAEMYDTFNMGVGFVLAAAADEHDAVVAHIESHGIPAFTIGRITRGAGRVVLEDIA